MNYVLLNESKIDNYFIIIIEKIIKEISTSTNNLNLDGLDLIIIKDDSFFNNISDARTVDKTVYIRKSFLINNIEEKNYSIIKSTIYHELCHIDIKNKYPKLHELYDFYLNEDDDTKVFTIMFFIEYITSIKSNLMESNETNKIFWESVYNKYWDFNNPVDRVYFIKESSYILARDNNNEIDMIIDSDTKKRLNDLKSIIDTIISGDLIDDYSILTPLENEVKKYII